MTLALEINDVGLILAADGELLVEEPGYAMLDGPEPETGAAAARRARLKPRRPTLKWPMPSSQASSSRT